MDTAVDFAAAFWTNFTLCRAEVITTIVAGRGVGWLRGHWLWMDQWNRKENIEKQCNLYLNFQGRIRL